MIFKMMGGMGEEGEREMRGKGRVEGEDQASQIGWGKIRDGKAKAKMKYWDEWQSLQKPRIE